MASIQPKTSRGNKYWYIVESRRVNGKPRPVVLEYLGKPETLLARLRNPAASLTVKSYSHGAVAAFLRLLEILQIPAIINRHVQSGRPYVADKPIRNNFTAGITLALAAVGRACMPTSKRGWWNWAKTTTCAYLLRANLTGVDSQHFWDLMDCIPVDAIPKIEVEILNAIRKHFNIASDTLLFDTTNFYTYIDSTNRRCTLAQRTKNSKQKRSDLRSVGMAMVVTRQDYIPLFHITYQGNTNDSVIFSKVIRKIKRRLLDLDLDLKAHTLVFDRGNNSKDNLKRLKRLKIHYVGALTPSHHLQLIAEAEENFRATDVGDSTVQMFRDKRVVWGQERTIIVMISERLRAGQLRGIYQALANKKARLRKLQRVLANPRAKKRDREKLENQIETILKGQYMEGLLNCCLTETEPGRFSLTYRTNKCAIDELEDHLGFRILMTDRHDWSSAAIVQAYYGQAAVEATFKNIKNPYHLAVRPQFHWTDQKIKVHYFTCVLACQLAALLWRQARREVGFKGTIDRLLDTLTNVRLATMVQKSKKERKPTPVFTLEEMSDEEARLMKALGVAQAHVKRPHIQEVSVYANGES